LGGITTLFNAVKRTLTENEKDWERKYEMGKDGGEAAIYKSERCGEKL